MSEPNSQSFDNHAKMVPAYHYVLFSIVVINLGYCCWILFKDFGVESVRQLLLALAFLLMTWYLRIFPLGAQDRVIRLEMKLRLEKVLPAELFARVDQIRRPQLIALRFASDAEMPELVRRVLGGELKTGKEIKQAIRNWQADHFRV